MSIQPLPGRGRAPIDPTNGIGRGLVLIGHEKGAELETCDRAGLGQCLRPMEEPVAFSDSAMRAAVQAWLKAAGLDLADPELQGTPERVSALWQASFLSGYRQDPAQILASRVPAQAKMDLVLLRDLPCHGMCPHHLMPWIGQATIAYLPNGELVGFGRLQELLNCFSRRLVLQEQVTHGVADALMQELGARGAACTIRAQHLCLSIPQDKHDARVHSTALRGEFEQRADLRLALMERV